MEPSLRSLRSLAEYVARARLQGKGAKVHASARIAPDARIAGERIVIGANVVVESGVRITAEEIRIEPECHLARGVTIDAKIAHIGRNCLFFPDVRIYALDHFVIDAYGKISKEAILKAPTIEIGMEFWMNARAEIGGGGWRSGDGRFWAGDRCHVGRNTHLNVAQPLSLGDWSAIGMDCTVATHGQWRPMTLGYKRHWGSVEIGCDVVIYSRCVLSPGVKIGDEATVAAGSVVTRDVPSQAFVAGVPARILRSQVPLPPQDQVVMDLMYEFHERRLPHWKLVRSTSALRIEPSSEEQVILYARQKEALVETPQRGGLITVVIDPDLIEKAKHTSSCLFDVGSRALYGQATATTESLRSFFHTAGIRFRYHGYQRTPLRYQELIDKGIE